VTKALLRRVSAESDLGLLSTGTDATYGMARGVVVERCNRSGIVSFLGAVGSRSMLGRRTIPLQEDLHGTYHDDPTHRATGDRARRAGHPP
jgi:hypothetical protein